MWEKWLKPDEQSRVPLACRAMLIEIDSKKILCETGIGAFFDPKMAERYGVVESDHVLLQSLNRLGIDQKEIDYVILSHLHFDHAGGLLPKWSDSSDGKAKELLFPAATYVVGTEAFARAETPHPRDRASFIPGMVELLKSSGRLQLISEGQTLLGGRISFFFTHGHTPGHMHAVIHGDREKVIFAGDLVPGRVWVHLPVTMGYDRYAERVIDEKASLYADIAGDSHAWLFYTHDHAAALSRVEKNEHGRFTATNDVAKPLRWQI
jgi:glyoxylase-like metal-dependent hydrolase (beta-lactamase superfamily II)